MQLNRAESNLDARTRAEIKAEMGRQSLSGSRLAQLLGHPQTYVSRRLRGEVNFSLTEVEEIALVLGVSLDQLMPTSKFHPRRQARRVS